MVGDYLRGDDEDKAGYNQAARITEILSALRTTFIGCMMENNLPSSLEACRGVLNVISGKVNETLIIALNNKVYEIEIKLPEANKIYVYNGASYFQNYKARTELKKNVEDLWREIERTQDEYGYGMISEEDTGL